MNDGEMGWGAPRPLSAPPKVEDAATGRPIPQECVGKDQNIDILIAPIINVRDEVRRGVESCLFGIRNDAEQIRHRPRISYCEAANRGLTKADSKLQLLVILIII